MQTPAWKECQDDLMRYAAKADIRRDTPRKLPQMQTLARQVFDRFVGLCR